MFSPHNKKVLFTTICELNEHRFYVYKIKCVFSIHMSSIIKIKNNNNKKKKIVNKYQSIWRKIDCSKSSNNNHVKMHV